ncbi:MAG: antitoxin Xre/MbcA/ParS toxin-binding domain-containing protein [Pseudomonadota bacterium]
MNRKRPFILADLPHEAETRKVTVEMNKGDKPSSNPSDAQTVQQLIDRAEAVFGNAESARRWLSKPKKQLSGLTPNEAMQDESGAELVNQLLRQIDYGYF